MKLPLAPLAVFKLVRELRESTTKSKPLVLGGAPLLVDALRRELVRGGDPTLVRGASIGALDGASALVYVLGGDVAEDDERALRAADVAGIPLVVLGPDPRQPIPYTLATDVLPLRPGQGFPLEELARVLGGKLDGDAAALAAKLPALRRGVAQALVGKVARQNGILSAAIFIPGVDYPVLTLNQLRLVLQLAAVHGQRIDVQRLPEILGVVGAGLGLRAVARQALGAIPFAGWAVQGAVAYTGTRALGDAAIRYFEARGAESSGRGGAESSATGADRA